MTTGFTAGVGNNLVQTEDISLLGSHYGVIGAPLLPYSYLDVGPTTNGFVDGRPTTDQRTNFEDLVIFALNYGLVSRPAATCPLPLARCPLPPDLCPLPCASAPSKGLGLQSHNRPPNSEAAFVRPCQKGTRSARGVTGR